MTSLLNSSTLTQTLEQALQTTYNHLTAFATAEDFTDKMTQSFGNNFDTEVAEKLAQDWAKGNFTALPSITIRSAVEINGAMGAFAKATNTIYLSREYLAQNAGNSEIVASVLLEEAGHYIDACVNDVETPGDEGAIFSALVRGKNLSEQELQQLRGEDDSATILLDGQILVIEQATFTGTNGNDILPASGTGNGGNDTFDPRLGNDTVNGGAGSDLLIVNYATAGSAGNGISSYVYGDGSGSFSAYNGSNYDQVNFTSIERFNVTGTNFDDAINGGTGNDTINGGTGNDTITGGGGIDKIDGGAGIDVLTDANFSTATANLAFDDTGTTNIALANGSTIVGIELFDNLKTGSGSDTISFSLRHNNTINTGAGNDTINSGLGYDSVDGGTGTDVLIVNYATAGSTGYGMYSYRSGDGSGYFHAYNGFSYDWVNFSGIEQFNVTGTNFDDTISGGAGNDTINGGTGNDTITGGSGIDKIDGGAGIDVLTDADFSTATTNLALDDTGTTNITLANGSSVSGIEVFEGVKTGSGSDTISFSLRRDNTINTGAGNDSINAGLGYDSVDGGTGTDVLIVNYATSGGSAYGGMSSSVYADGSGSFYAYNGFSYDWVNFSGIEQFNVTGTNFNDTISGGAGNDTINGGTGNDTITGGSGIDKIDGGAGIDVLTDADFSTATTNLALDDTGTTNITLANGSSVSGIEVFEGVKTGSGSDTISFSLRRDNTINTGAGNDTINSGLGNDSVDGGIGTDVLIVNYATAGSAGYGISSYDYGNGSGYFSTYNGSSYDSVGFSGIEQFNVTGTNFDDTFYGSTLNDTLNGGGGNDSINGGDGNDILDGGLGADQLIGGLGNDIYVVNIAGNSGDIITEYADEGIDTVQSSVNWTLGATSNLENLTLTGTAALIGTGNSLNNIITGNSGANSLNGGAGIDTLIGGNGNDTYIVDSTTDTITETTTGGIDTVQSSVSYTLTENSNLENLTLTGTAALNGTGNSLNNTITGNSGANTLNGGAGIDTLIGGNGNDIYIVDSTTDTITETATGGTDTVESSVSYTLVENSNLENLTLTGTNAINGTGNSLNNTITGNSGANTLNGGTGIDTLIGGDSNDTYVVDSTTDTITETATGGTDTVESSVSYTLLENSNLENLTLTGTSAIDGTGNSLNNTLTGNSGANTLTGLAGNDILDGGAGIDTLIGGDGNDTYIVDSTTDTITETATGGIDTVQSSVSFTLAENSNLENLTLTGTSAINGTGNSLNNTITGNSGANTLDGGAGIDTLIGGNGNDIYIVDSTTDTITETATGGTDTVQSSVSYTLGTTSNLENLTLTGTAAINGTGNSLNNTITGNSDANTLNGGAGIDTLIGGDGNDTYIVDSTTDTITETATGGTDTVESSVSFTLAENSNLENLTLTGTSTINGTGNSLNNTITGNSGANTLTGLAGIDTLIGGNGNDTYIVDTTTDTITETTTGGIDTVQSSVSYTLADNSNLENLTLAGASAIDGTGNNLNNTITGNSGANTLTGLAGNDILNGGAGIDTLIGGDGSDIYIVDSITDTITETTTGGTDTVQSSVSYTLGDTSYLENLTLTGTGAINGTGNSFNNVITGNSGANTLTGLAGNDTLNGGAGIDTLIGGDGNDIYIVDSTTDTITETATGGIDTVQSSVSYTLAENSNLENLTLTGSSAINGTGNSLNNSITGNAANNLLDGGAGNDALIGGLGNDTLVGGLANDTLTGGAGLDSFTFNAPNQGVDTIADFVVIDDAIVVSATGFGGNLIAGAAITADQFVLGSAATDASDRFIYNSTNGALFFDVDGTGSIAGMQIATLSTKPLITNADIVVIA